MLLPGDLVQGGLLSDDLLTLGLLLARPLTLLLLILLLLLMQTARRVLLLLALHTAHYLHDLHDAEWPRESNRRPLVLRTVV